MVEFNVIYAAYMPCRISMVEDGAGQVWLVTLNLDMFIENVILPNNIQRLAIETNNSMLTIMTAGATGEF
jgi:uncharacterized protein (DUF302 family)